MSGFPGRESKHPLGRLVPRVTRQGLPRTDHLDVFQVLCRKSAINAVS